ncbi:YIEGIA domain-containing protein [Brevibacillus laterosporus]|uniref:YIEGIA domain-containing protein n=1 Tax=Brevibacillus laterosporus TaxID=1465 RepID=UPI000839D703|nr:YIEGIA domain-containing protein [Brevibacillus laterosporus]
MDGRESILSVDHLTIILTAMVMGTLARIFVLKEDYRQYPSYPNGFMIHILIGFIASTLGAVFVPAIMSSNWIAVTFLSLAIQQFRDVRKIEQESLRNLEKTEFTPRGEAYIDGIAKTFESRNYLALVVSISTATVMYVFKSLMLIVNVGIGVITGLVILLFIKRFSKGKQVGDIAIVKKGKIEIRESGLFVDGVFVSTIIGTANVQNVILEEAFAVTIEPNEEYLRIILDNYGQRKAILFEATRSIGVKRYHYTCKDFKSGKTIIVIVPLIRNIDKLLHAVKNTPLLESVKKNPSLMDSSV